MANLYDVMRRLEKRFESRRQAVAKTYRAMPGRQSLSPRLAGGLVQRSFSSESHDGEVGIADRPTLFNSDNGRRRAYLKGVPVNISGVGRATYRGQELRGDDQAVWLQIMERVKQQPQSAWIEFTPRSILKTMGWGTSTHDHARLRDCLERMQATVLGLSQGVGETGVRVSLIDKCEWLSPKAGKPGRWRVWVEPELRGIFGGCSSAELEPSRTVEVLAERLRRLFGNYAKPYPRRVDTLWRRCGADIRTEQIFRSRLKAALKMLKTRGFLDDYQIDDNDLVRVVRTEQVPQEEPADPKACP